MSWPRIGPSKAAPIPPTTTSARLAEAEAVLDLIYEAARAGLCASTRRQAGLAEMSAVGAATIAAQDALLDVTNAVTTYRGVA